jgi:hypothetical protein
LCDLAAAVGLDTGIGFNTINLSATSAVGRIG